MPLSSNGLFLSPLIPFQSPLPFTPSVIVSFPLSFFTYKSSYIISQFCCESSSSSLINQFPHLYFPFFLVCYVTLSMLCKFSFCFLTAHTIDTEKIYRTVWEIEQKYVMFANLSCLPSFMSFSINFQRWKINNLKRITSLVKNEKILKENRKRK